MQKVILKIEGMSCSACSNHVQKYLNKQPGIIDVTVNLVLGTALVFYEDDISIDTIGKYINDSGYKYGGIYNEREENKKDHKILYLILLAILMVIIMYISMAHMLHLPIISFLNMMTNPSGYAITLGILTIPYLIYGRDILKNGLKNLIHKSANMDTLVTLGVLVSFIYSFINLILILLGHSNYVENLYFESVCMIILFIKLGRIIDYNSKEKTKEAIKELVQVTPEQALLKTKNTEKIITIDEVKPGDTLIVKPGMKVAVDGSIIKGSAHFDESFITGESKPAKKEKGDKIMAGSIDYDGHVLYKAEKIGPKSTISEMVHLVINATNSKMPISRIADKVSSIFVPIIMIIAILTFIVYLIMGSPFNEALIHMVTVLVVACPCALGLATPLAIVVSIGTCAKEGILIKSSETLEIASHIDTIIFDKTGTLTYGKLQINKFYNYSPYSDKELLNIVANIENNSSHPIANAFKSYQTKELLIENYQEKSGLGITATIDNKKYALGNRKILANIKNTYQQEEEKLANAGNSIIYILEDNKIIGLLGIKDTIRPEAKQTIQSLTKLGINIIMLTGDNALTASIIGKELGIKNIVSECLPTDKTKYIENLQNEGKKVAMVGDGINDAPSLATALIGISFKGSTDIATNSANVIITTNSLEEIIKFLQMGKRTLKNIKQNLFWAFFYNILMIPIACGVFENLGLKINPMIASAAMMLSSLCVVFNALRLKKVGGQ